MNNCYSSNIIDNVCANIDCTISDQALQSVSFFLFPIPLNLLGKSKCSFEVFYLCKNSNCTSSDQALHPLLLVVIAALAQITKDKR